jgi:hypothetical protein
MISRMADGMRLNVVELELDGSGRGTLTLRLATLAEFKAALAHFHSGPTLQDPSGRMRRLRLDGLPAQPPQFPSDVALAVVEQKLPQDAVTQRMAFGNNYLQAGGWVQVISFTPPSQDGREGLLRVHCATEDEYRQIRRFVDEGHGSALKALDGGLWYVHRISDDARSGEPFPQNVNIHLEWRYRD